MLLGPTLRLSLMPRRRRVGPGFWFDLEAPAYFARPTQSQWQRENTGICVTTCFCVCFSEASKQTNNNIFFLCDGLQKNQRALIKEPAYTKRPSHNTWRGRHKQQQQQQRQGESGKRQQSHCFLIVLRLLFRSRAATSDLSSRQVSRCVVVRSCPNTDPRRIFV